MKIIDNTKTNWFVECGCCKALLHIGICDLHVSARDHKTLRLKCKNCQVSNSIDIKLNEDIIRHIKSGDYEGRYTATVIKPENLPFQKPGYSDNSEIGHLVVGKPDPVVVFNLDQD